MKASISSLSVIALPALAGLVVALTGSTGAAHLAAQLLLMAVFAAAFDLAYGVTGLFSFGHAAFFGIGAYVYALSGEPLGFGAASLGIAILCSGIAALIFGLLAGRSTGLYFALTTFALGQLVNIVVEVKLREWSGGSDGISDVGRPSLLGFTFNTTSSFLMLCSAVYALVMGWLIVLRNSPYGQVLCAVRDNPTRADQLGYNVRVYRLSALVISGGLSGAAGALYGALNLFVSPDLLRWTLSGDVLMMTVLGGAGTVAGPLLGVGLFELAKEVFSRFTEYWYGALGIVFIGCTLFFPRGLNGMLTMRATAARMPELRESENVG